MGVRRRAVRERLERKRARAKGIAEFNASLDHVKHVVDGAIAEGLKTMTSEEFSRRLTLGIARDQCGMNCPNCGHRAGQEGIFIRCFNCGWNGGAYPGQTNDESPEAAMLPVAYGEADGG